MNIQPYKDCLAHKNSIYISNDDEPYKPCCWFKTGIKADSLADYRNKLSELDIEKYEVMVAIADSRDRYDTIQRLPKGIKFFKFIDMFGLEVAGSSALKSLDALGLRGKIAIVGIAKRLEELFYPEDPIPLYLDKKSETLKIIQFLRKTLLKKLN